MGDGWFKMYSRILRAAFHTAFPALFALNFGAKFHFMNNPDAIDTVTCPDGGILF